MSKPGDSFVAEDFLRAGKGDAFLWAAASLIVIAGLGGGYWAYLTFAPVEDGPGPTAEAVMVEFAEFAVSPVMEEPDIAEGEFSAASEAMPPSEVEPEAEPIGEPAPEPLPEPVPQEPVVEPADPNRPVPVTMPQRIADMWANTPATEFTPPPRRAPPPQQAASQASAPKPQAQQAEQAAAPQQPASSEPSAAQVSRWETSVLRHLGQRRNYPAEARQRGETGRVVVQFTIDAAGNVLSAGIARSSGFAALDQAARDLVEASSPVPRPPEGLPQSRLTIAVPVDYGR